MSKPHSFLSSLVLFSLTAAKWDRALLPGRTFYLSLMSLRTRLWNTCVIWALHNQSQPSSSTACALTKACTRCHSFCKNKASILLPWPGLNTNQSLHCAVEKWSQSQHKENAAGCLATADVPSPALGKLQSHQFWEDGQHLTAACWGGADSEALLHPFTPSKSRDETCASYKQVYLHFDWSTDSRYRFLLHNSTRASAKYAFLIFMYKKNPQNKTEKKNKKKKNRNKQKDKECGSIYSQLVRLSLPSTHLHSPSPIALTLQSASLPRTAALSAKRGNSLSPWKDKRSPQANWDNSRLLKIVGHTSCSPMRPPTARRRILREYQKKPKKVQIRNAQKIRHQHKPLFFVKQRQEC